MENCIVIYTTVQCKPSCIPTKVHVDDKLIAMQPIFCLYAICDDCEDDNITIKISKEELEKIGKDLGKYVTVISDVPAFIEKLNRGRNRLWYGLCEYIQELNEFHNAHIIEFSKDGKYEHEKEFRILARDALIKRNDEEIEDSYYKDYMILDKCLFLQLGNLRNIASAYSIKDLVNGLKIKVKLDYRKSKIENLSNIDGYFDED